MRATVTSKHRRVKLITEDALAQIARTARANIRADSKAGVSPSGARLAPHADGSRVDLTVTGAMLDTLKIEVDGDTSRVVATVPYAQFVNAQREFMGASDATQEAAARIHQEASNRGLTEGPLIKAPRTFGAF